MSRFHFAALALLPHLVATVAAAEPHAIAPRLTKGHIHVDGDLTEWNMGLHSIAPPLFFGEGTVFTEEGEVRGNGDQSARLYFAVDGHELLVAAYVVDDAVVTERWGEQWRGDGVELLFVRAGQPMLHVGINPVGDVHLFSAEAPNAKVPAMRSAARLEPFGWAVEVALPFKALLAPSAPSRPPSLAINIAMRDVDAPSGPAAHRVWGGQRHGLPASAGRLWIQNNGPTPTRWPDCPELGPEVRLDRPLTRDGKKLVAGQSPVTLRLLNFQSSVNNWQSFWSQWNELQVQRDLDVAKRLKANAIRIFVFTEAFGEDALVPTMLERLKWLVREAASRGLLSVVTFFPFKKEFRPQWRERMQRHLEQVVGSFTGDPAIAMWDLMNEPDHMWAADAGVTASDVGSWARQMFDAVRQADRTHLITVGQYGHYLFQPNATEDEELPFTDVASVHWYGERSALDATFARMAESQRPLVLQEFGYSSLFVTDAEAADQLQQVCTKAQVLGFAGVGLWELFDHPVGSIAHQQPRYTETAENSFGLVRVDGVPKAQASVFCRCLRPPKFRIGRPTLQGK